MAMRGAKIDTKQRNTKIYSEISARLLRLKICHFWRAIFRLANSSVGAAFVDFAMCAVIALGVGCVLGVARYFVLFGFCAHLIEVFDYLACIVVVILVQFLCRPITFADFSKVV